MVVDLHLVVASGGKLVLLIISTVEMETDLMMIMSVMVFEE